ncbi:MAG: multidrug efflux SMR transporter [Rhodobacteraceae bacterium]|nr:multidrug efflux SMR transporter [Paracoccaceae bacterium]
MSRAWALVLLAGAMEILWALGLKYSEGFTRLWPTAAVVVFGFASFFVLAEAAKTLPLGTAYAVWVGIGALGTAIAGMILFAEPATTLRFAGILLIVAGIVVLKLA